MYLELYLLTSPDQIRCKNKHYLSLQAMTRGDLEVLESWCYEAPFNILATPVRQARQMGYVISSQVGQFYYHTFKQKFWKVKFLYSCNTCYISLTDGICYFFSGRSFSLPHLNNNYEKCEIFKFLQHLLDKPDRWDMLFLLR